MPVEFRMVLRVAGRAISSTTHRLPGPIPVASLNWHAFDCQAGDERRPPETYFILPNAVTATASSGGSDDQCAVGSLPRHSNVAQ
jgi:hypothetical protein